ncbi:TPA: ABC transporter permease [Candidatus Nomurabacteria bacterium]|nr:MAG: Cell division protein FtsX [Parcubacteria bacterium RAAC4_OD1_1]HCY26330.1 ABC transporter permease [Candidatus Nomurabacteria bacterium]
MFTTNLKRVIVSGFRSFVRSGFTSLAGVLVMTITLFVITSQIFVQAALNSALSDIKEKVDITVYFIPNVSEDDIKEIEFALKGLPEVKDVSYTSQEEALNEFKEKHANDFLTLQALEELGENPLGASLNVKAKDPSQYESISNYFEDNGVLSNSSLNIIDKIDYHDNKLIIDRLSSIISKAERLGILISFILILISIIITFNTIRLIIYMSKEEISVMKLVGAGSRYIRGPFIVSGVLVGIISAFVTTIIFIPVSIWLGDTMTDFVGVNMFEYFKSNFIQLFLIMIISGVIIGGISSIFAIARYLRK